MDQIKISSQNLGTGLTITNGGETITSGGLTVSAGGAAITGTTTINTTGSSNTSIGNASSTTAITGPTNINISGSAAATSIATGTGSLTLGNSTGNTVINGAVTITPGANQVGLSITGNGNAAAASLIASTTSPALLLAGQGSTTAPALRMTGVPAAVSGNFLLAIDNAGNVTETSITDSTLTNAIINGGQPGPLTIGTTNLTSLNFITNNTPALSITSGGAVTISPTSGTGLTITNGGETITSGILTVVSGGASITGTTTINTTGSASTSIGTSSGTNTVLGTTGINTSGAAATNIGNASSTTTITGPTNINNSGSALTQIGTTPGGGQVSIGNTTGNTVITGNLSINPGTGQTGLNVATPGGTATAVNIDTSAASGSAARMIGNASSPTLLLIGNSTLTAPALRMTGVPAAATSNFLLAIDGNGNVTETTTTTGNVIFNGGQPGPLTIGTTNATPLTFITNGTNKPRLSIDANGGVTINTPDTAETALTVVGNGASITGTTSVTGTTNINTSGTAATNIGNSTGPSTNTILGTTTINTTGSSQTTIGNGASTTILTGPVGINTTGSGSSTQIGTGATGSVNIGNIIGLTGISGAVTITPGPSQVGLSITGNGTGAAASLTASSSAPALLLTGQGSTTAPALRMLGVPTAALTDSILTIDSSGNVRESASSNFIFNGGQLGPLTIGTTNATSFAIETNSVGRLLIDGSTGSVLNSMAYRMSAFLNATTAFNTTTAAIVFNTKSYDPNGNYSTSTGLYTVPRTGYYLVTSTVTFQKTAGGNASASLQILLNGAAVTGYTANGSATVNALSFPVTVCTIISATAGQTIGMQTTTTGSMSSQANQANFTVHFMSF